MTILVFDCETTGLINYKTHEYPYIVQLAWITYSDDEYRENNHIIRPDIPIPIESSNIHKITQDIADKKGILIQDALILFLKDFRTATTIIAHNMSFDLTVLKKECERNHISMPTTFKTYYCTMKNSIDLCRIKMKSTRNPDETYFKYPKLIELFKHLFPEEELANLHNALVDNIVCLRCYYMMVHHRDLCEEDHFRTRFIHLTNEISD
jgi:DNA polymerase III subunit epsilon